MTAEQLLTRGKGNFINCTDYDDAIEAMEKYANYKCQELLKEIIGEIEKEAIDEEDCRNGKRIGYDTVMDLLTQKLKEADNGK